MQSRVHVLLQSIQTGSDQKDLDIALAAITDIFIHQSPATIPLVLDDVLLHTAPFAGLRGGVAHLLQKVLELDGSRVPLDYTLMSRIASTLSYIISDHTAGYLAPGIIAATAFLKRTIVSVSMDRTPPTNERYASIKGCWNAVKTITTTIANTHVLRGQNKAARKQAIHYIHTLCLYLAPQPAPTQRVTRMPADTGNPVVFGVDASIGFQAATLQASPILSDSFQVAKTGCQVLTSALGVKNLEKDFALIIINNIQQLCFQRPSLWSSLIPDLSHRARILGRFMRTINKAEQDWEVQGEGLGDDNGETPPAETLDKGVRDAYANALLLILSLTSEGVMPFRVEVALSLGFVTDKSGMETAKTILSKLKIYATQTHSANANEALRDAAARDEIQCGKALAEIKKREEGRLKRQAEGGVEGEPAAKMMRLDDGMTPAPPPSIGAQAPPPVPMMGGPAMPATMMPGYAPAPVGPPPLGVMGSMPPPTPTAPMGMGVTSMQPPMGAMGPMGRPMGAAPMAPPMPPAIQPVHPATAAALHEVGQIEVSKLITLLLANLSAYDTRTDLGERHREVWQWSATTRADGAVPELRREQLFERLPAPVEPPPRGAGVAGEDALGFLSSLAESASPSGVAAAVQAVEAAQKVQPGTAVRRQLGNADVVRNHYRRCFARMLKFVNGPRKPRKHEMHVAHAMIVRMVTQTPWGGAERNKDTSLRDLLLGCIGEDLSGQFELLIQWIYQVYSFTLSKQVQGDENYTELLQTVLAGIPMEKWIGPVRDSESVGGVAGAAPQAALGEFFLAIPHIPSSLFNHLCTDIINTAVERIVSKDDFNSRVVQKCVDALGEVVEHRPGFRDDALDVLLNLAYSGKHVNMYATARMIRLVKEPPTLNVKSTITAFVVQRLQDLGASSAAQLGPTELQANVMRVMSVAVALFVADPNTVAYLFSTFEQASPEVQKLLIDNIAMNRLFQRGYIKGDALETTLKSAPINSYHLIRHVLTLLIEHQLGDAAANARLLDTVCALSAHHQEYRYLVPIAGLLADKPEMFGQYLTNILSIKDGEDVRQAFGRIVQSKAGGTRLLSLLMEREFSKQTSEAITLAVEVTIAKEVDDIVSVAQATVPKDDRNQSVIAFYIFMLLKALEELNKVVESGPADRGPKALRAMQSIKTNVLINLAGHLSSMGQVNDQVVSGLQKIIFGYLPETVTAFLRLSDPLGIRLLEKTSEVQVTHLRQLLAQIGQRSTAMEKRQQM